MYATVTFMVMLSVCIVPVIILLAGWTMRSIVPSEPNRFFGYRTRLSMSSQEAWNYANAYMGRQWGKLGLIELAVSAALTATVLLLLGQEVLTPVGASVLMWTVLPGVTVQTGCMLLSIWAGERHLRSVFNADGTRRQA